MDGIKMQLTVAPLTRQGTKYGGINPTYWKRQKKGSMPIQSRLVKVPPI
jgi:hypothetical protein